MNQRKAGAALSYISIFITNTISLFYTPYMLRMMGQSEYGLYGTAGSFISYLSVLSFGIGGAYIRFNAQARAKQDREEERRLNGMFLAIFLVLAGLVLIGGVGAIALAGQLVKNTFTPEELFKLRVIMLILTVNMMVSFICNVFMMALQAYEQFFVIRIVLLAAGIVQPIINVIALRAGGRAITITIISFVIGLISYLVLFIYARRAIRFEITFRGFQKEAMREIFVFSGFLFLNSITDQITFSTDAVILSSVKGSAAVAIYNVGASFKGYFQSFSTAISSVFAPQVNQLVAQHKPMETLDELFIRVGRIQFYIVSLIMIGYCSIGHDFVRLWAGHDYGNAFYIGLLLMLAVTVPSFQNVGLEIQKAMNMHKARSIAYFLIALINVLLTIPLTKKWGGIGAALATLVCMFVGTVLFMNYYYAKKIKLDIKQFWISVIRLFPGMVIPVIVGICINNFWKMNSYLEILAGALIITVFFAVSVWLFSMNEYEKRLIQTPLIKLKGVIGRR